MGAGLFANTVVVALVPLAAGSEAQMDQQVLTRDLGHLEIGSFFGGKKWW